MISNGESVSISQIRRENELKHWRIYGLNDLALSCDGTTAAGTDRLLAHLGPQRRPRIRLMESVTVVFAKEIL